MTETILSHDILPQLSDNARLWVFQSNKILKAEEKKVIQAVLGEFVPNWAAHGKALKADFQIIHNSLILVAVDETQQNATGCSIDSLHHCIQGVEYQLNIELLNRWNILCFENENTQGTIHNIQTSATQIKTNYFFYNNTFTLLGDWRKSAFSPVKNSWVANFIS